MAKAVYRFTLEDAISQKISLRKGSVVLSCELQVGKICLWALEDLDAPFEPREVLTLATGYKIEPNSIEFFDFVGTVHDRNRGEVWHVFVEQAIRVITPESVAATSKDLDRTGKQVDLEREIIELNDQIETLELERNALRAQNLGLDNKAKIVSSSTRISDIISSKGNG